MAKHKFNITQIRIAQERSSRTNPLRNFSEQKLAYMLENFALGWLADAARLFDALERRDDIISAVSNKRRKSVSRLNWNIDGNIYEFEGAVLEDFSTIEQIGVSLECEYKFKAKEIIN